MILRGLEIIEACNNRQVVTIKKLSGRRDEKMFKKFTCEIKSAVEKSSNIKWEIAVLFSAFVQSGAFMVYFKETAEKYSKYFDEHKGSSIRGNPYAPIGGSYGEINSISLFAWAKDNIGFSKTYVYNLLEVVDEFADFSLVVSDKDGLPCFADYVNAYKIKPEALKYQFWQLVEMLPLTPEEREEILPSWTREEIRAYKKSLKDSKKEEEQSEEPSVEVEEPIVPEKYARFDKFSRLDLMNKIIDLETEYEKLQIEFEKTSKLLSEVYSALPSKRTKDT